MDFEARKMRCIRAYRGVSQTDLSKLVGISQQMLSGIETGLVLPTPEVEALIKEALEWNEALRDLRGVSNQVAVRQI